MRCVGVYQYGPILDPPDPPTQDRKLLHCFFNCGRDVVAACFFKARDHATRHSDALDGHCGMHS
jgi:hypothetical protein